MVLSAGFLSGAMAAALRGAAGGPCPVVEACRLTRVRPPGKGALGQWPRLNRKKRSVAQARTVQSESDDGRVLSHDVRLARGHGPPRCSRVGVARETAETNRLRRDRGAVQPRRSLSKPRRDGAARLRTR